MTDEQLRLILAEWLWGWTPHPSQRQWLLARARTKTAACGRRWGKTEAAAIDAAAMALTSPGSVQMIVSPTYDQSRLIFDAVEQLMMSSPITRPLSKVTRTPYPRLSVGRSKVMARTADEDGRNLRGHSADRVIVDEAAYVRDGVIQEVIAPMLADRNGHLVMVSTPFGKNHFYRAFTRGIQEQPARDGEADYASFTFPSWSNPHISSDYIERQRTELSIRQFAVEYEAQFMDDVSSVFTWNEINSAADRGRGEDAGSFEIVVAGIDWARYSDYTAVALAGVRDGVVTVFAIDRFNGMDWSAQIQRVADFLTSHRVCSALADQTSVGDPLLEQLRAKLWEIGSGTVVEGYGFTNQSKRDLIENLSLKFSHDQIALPRDETLIKELQYFEYELTSSGNVRMNAHAGHHDDIVIAVALASWQAKGAAAMSGGILGHDGRVAVKGW